MSSTTNADAAAAITARRRKYFETDPRRFKFHKHLASGGNGDTYVFCELDDRGVERRKFVAKYSTSGPRSLNQLSNEIRIAQKLYGAMHIAQPIVEDGGMRTLRRGGGGGGAGTGAASSLPPEDRDVLMTEYLAGLTLQQFIDNARKYDVVPNRVLWMIFLCLTRMVIAMAYPPNKPYGAATEDPTVETIPQIRTDTSETGKGTTSAESLTEQLGALSVKGPKDRTGAPAENTTKDNTAAAGSSKSDDIPETEPTTRPAAEPTDKDYQIFHGDMDNLNNFVFGDYDPDEHWLVPILKAIDFGLAVDQIGTRLEGRMLPFVSPGTFTQANIYDIGRAIQRVYNHHDSPDPPAIRFPNLDQDLYQLAARCASRDHTQRPSLAELVRTVEHNVNTKTGPEHFLGKPYAWYEETETLRGYIWDVLLSPAQKGLAP
ncbi:Uu.00g112520.m01.CDS01 [Anthostomella pinea]|uniref:Uu.00g112520.m01.CDS01 n=1 Tax=Anthostomella pinea TaxID=933095 RepID=A0AAI8VFB9_9PEZI|nr:Uu.00g112520.m01.CDS01 [Anthostomella pinea]